MARSHGLWAVVLLVLSCMYPSTGRADENKSSEPCYRGKTVKSWAQSLNSPDRATYVRACEELTAVTNPPPDELFLLLSALLKSESVQVRRTAVGLLGPTFREKPGAATLLTSVLKDTDAKLRLEAFDWLGRLTFLTGAIPALGDCIDGPDVEARLRAAMLLFKCHPEDSARVSRVSLKELDNKDYAIRCLAARVLESMGRSARAAVPALIKTAIRDDDSDVRTVAIEALAAIEPDDKQLAPLIDLLQDKRSWERALTALTTMKAKTRAVGYAIAALLKSPDVEVRQRAARSLTEMFSRPETDWQGMGHIFDLSGRFVFKTEVRGFENGPPFEVIALALAGALKDSDFVVRERALDALENLGSRAQPAAPALLGCLEDPMAWIRQRALAVLARISLPSKKITPALARALADDNSDVCQAAARALAKLGPRGSGAKAALLKALRSSDKALSCEAALALAEIERPAKNLIPPLIDALRNSSARVRRSAAEALTRVKRPCPELVESLNALLMANEPAPGEAVQILIGLPWNDERVFTRVLKALEHKDQQVRSPAVKEVLESLWAFRQLTPPHVAQLGRVLKKLAHGADKEVACQAARALVTLPSEWKTEGVDALTELLTEPKGNQLGASIALSEAGVDARRALPRLIAALKGKDSSVRYFVVDALGFMGKEGRDAVPALIPLLENQDRRLVRSTIRALEMVGADSRAAVPSLLQRLKPPHLDWAVTASALAKIDPDRARQAVPGLIAFLDNPSAFTCMEAIDALGALGPLAKAALPALLPALNQREPRLRALAAITVIKIEPNNAEAWRLLFDLWAKHADYLGHDRRLRTWSWDVRTAEISQPAFLIPILKTAFKAPDVGVRRGAADILAGCAGRIESALPVLISALSDADANVRQSAAKGLQNMKEDAKPAAPALIQRLQDDELEVQLAAMKALAKIGPSAGAAAPSLSAILRDSTRRKELASKPFPLSMIKISHHDSEELLIEAALALVAIDPERDAESVAALVPLLTNQKASVRAAASHAMLSLEDEQGTTISHLKAALAEEDDNQTRVCLAQALWHADPEAEEFVPALIGALESEYGDAHPQALIALALIGPPAEKALPHLLRAAKSPRWQVQLLSRAVLARVDPAQVKASTKALIRSLKESDSEMRALAAKSLGMIGRPANAAAAVLRDLARHDDDDAVREAAAWALRRIGVGHL